MLNHLRTILQCVRNGYQSPWGPVPQAGSRIIRTLTEEEISDYEEIHELDSVLRASLRNSLRHLNRFEAKHFLFLDRLMMSDERVQTAEDRGMVLSFAELSDGTRVIVEFPESVE